MKGNFHVRFLGECGRSNPPALTRSTSHPSAVMAFPSRPERWTCKPLEGEEHCEQGSRWCGQATKGEIPIRCARA